MKKLMLTCREVPDVLLTEPRGFTTHVALRFHLFICQRCRQLEAQYTLLQLRLRSLAAPRPASPELVTRIVSDALELRKP